MATLLRPRRLRTATAVAAVVTLLAGAGSARPAVALTPSDPGWADAWGARQVHLPDAWEVTTGDRPVVVATIDTGAQPVADLAGALTPGWDFVEGDAVPRDALGHGTAVASVIAARANNGVGIAGVCWSCLVMPIRVAEGGEAEPPVMAEGIRWAVDHGARVLNISLVSPEPDPAVEAAVAYAAAHDVLVVASAGNLGTDQPSYPAALPGVLAVAGTDDQDRLYDWSSRGAWVALAAPGCQPVDARPGGWGILCGSSVAPAVVSGIAGLILSIDPSLTASQVAAALTASAVPVAGIGGGRVDAYGALTALGLAPRQPTARFQSAVLTESGLLDGGFQRTFSVGAGAFHLELDTADADRCSATLLTGSEAVTATGSASTRQVVLDARVAEGSVSVVVSCRGESGRPYSLSVVAQLPTS